MKMMGLLAGRSRKSRLSGSLQLGFMFLVAPLIAGAQDDAESIERLLLRSDPTLVAPVVIGGEELLRVRGVSAYPAERRAEVVREQIIAIARDESVDVDSGRIQVDADRVRIYFGNELAVSLFADDAELEGIEELPVLAEAVLMRISEAIEQYRDSRSQPALLRSTLMFILLTITAALLSYLIARLFGWLNRIVRTKADSVGRRLGETSRRIIDVDQLALWSLGSLRIVLFVLILVIVLVWLNVSLSLYTWTRPFATQVFDLILDPVRILATGLLAQIPNLVFLTLLGLIVRLLLGGAKHFFDRVDRGAVSLSNFDRDWAMPTYRVVRLLVIAFAVIVAYPYIPGSSSEAFKGVSIFLGVVFSIGSSSFVGSTIAGYILIYRRAYHKGDLVKIGAMTGFVVETRMLGTQLRSLKNEIINIPNSTVLNSEIINFSSLQKEGGLILHTQVSIGYDVPWRQVERLLLEAAERTEGVCDKPPPFVLRKNLDNFAVVYELNGYCDRADQMVSIYSVLHSNILDTFNEAGIQIMSPHYVSDPATPKVPKTTG